MTDEESGAAAFRASLLRREAAEAARAARLAGSPSARAALEADWQPITRKDEVTDGRYEEDDEAKAGPVRMG